MTSLQSDEPVRYVIIDNPSVAERYANRIISASFDGAVVSIASALRDVGTKALDIIPHIGGWVQPQKTFNIWD